MAGHSKWAQIKRMKAVKDARKGANFAQCSREIMMAAKLGGGDPEGNFRLKTAIQRAKTAGVPNDNIRRAIEKGVSGGGGEGMENLSYEGYGPGGVAIFIEAVTDNRNRTAGDIRSYFNKYSGNLGADGCVAWIFEEKGLIRVPRDGFSEEQVFDQAIEAGALDFQANDDEVVYDIYTTPTELNAVCQALAQAGIPVQSAEATRIPQNTVKVESVEVAKPLLKLLDMLESHDDVQQVYANLDMSESLLGQMEQV